MPTSRSGVGMRAVRRRPRRYCRSAVDSPSLPGLCCLTAFDWQDHAPFACPHCVAQHLVASRPGQISWPGHYAELHPTHKLKSSLMITKRTTLILGAGASAHLGYPIGTGLRDQMLENMAKKQEVLSHGKHGMLFQSLSKNLLQSNRNPHLAGEGIDLR